MVQYRHLWVGEQFIYEGQTYTKSNHGRSFYVVRPGNGARPERIFRKLAKNRNVEPLTERLKNG